MTVHEALKLKYALPHYITLFEVRDSTGFDSSRSADAIVISLYASRGREVIGFEIKHNRADWLRELKDPSKAEQIGKFCDYFYLLTPHVPEQCKLGEKPEIIAKMEEIPGPWGWMVLKGERLKVLKQPEKIKAIPPDREMLCSLLYATKERAFAEANAQLGDRVQEEIKRTHSSNLYRLTQAEKGFENLQQIVREFEDATGLDVHHQSYIHGLTQKERLPIMGAAVKILMSANGSLDSYRRQLEYSANGARSLLMELEKAKDEVDKIVAGSKTELDNES